ncbi:MAG: TlpA disulfide reductase family protein [Pyrinomonadaceae bacterium]
MRNSLLLLVLAIAFSSCSDRSSTKTVGSDQATESASNDEVSGSEPKKKSEYPALPEKIAQAEMGNLDRTTTTIAERKGKVVLLNLWATWCGFCRQEMPILVKMQDQHRDAGFEVLGLNIDEESVDQINEFAEEMKLNYTLVWADAKTTNELLKVSKFQGIPQSFLVDRDGNLRGVFTGADPRNLKKMEDLVANLVAE